MKTMTILLPLSILLSAGVASAQDADPDVSTMQGQLVKVGEQNDYRYSFPRWNVSTNPLGMIIGSYGASLSYAPMTNLALRVDANYYNDPESDLAGFEVGLGAPIYFKKMYNGLFLEPGVIYHRISEGGESAQAVGPSAMLGYHWFWDSGLNVAVALGAGRNFVDSDDEVFDDFDKIFPTGYLRFGYAF